MPMKNKLLMLYAIGIVPVMIAGFCYFGRYTDKYVNYFVPYAIYLFLLLVGILIFARGEKKQVKQSPKGRIACYLMAFIPVVATFFVAFLPTLPQMTTKLILITGIYALVNGTLEELFWRYTFHQVFGDKMLLAYVIPTVLFTSWHLALTFANGISYHGGALALVGGAGVMGAIWGFVMYRTGNIKVVVVAHVCANFFAFSQLIAQNFLIT